MRPLFATLLIITALLSSTAAAQTIPATAINPAATAQSLSTDTKLSSDTDLSSDAATLAGVTAPAPISAAQARVNEGHIKIDHWMIQLERDILAHADRNVIKADKAKLKGAQRQLLLDQRACAAELRANPDAVNPQLRTNACK